jgi:hypothetical protein
MHYLPSGLCDIPAPGDLVPFLIHRGHNGIHWHRSADQKPEPPLISEQDASASPPGAIASGGMQDGRSRLIDEFAEENVGLKSLIRPEITGARILRVMPNIVPYGEPGTQPRPGKMIRTVDAR